MDGYSGSVQLLKALAHPARLKLLYALRDEEACVCHLTALLKERQAYVSQQLISLREAGLIQDRKDGLRVYYRIKEPRVLELLAALEQVAGGKRETLVHPLAHCPCPKCCGETTPKRKRSARGGRA